MKTRMTIVMSLLLLATSSLVFAQKKGKGDEEDEKFKIMVGGSFAKPKIIPALDKLALTQFRVNYKMTTTARAMTNQKKDDGMIAGAKITATLETTDGELSPADFQEITDYAYNYFQKALNDNNIAAVDWSKITATDFYQTGADDTKEKTGDAGSANVYYTSVANKGNVLWNGVTGFAFGKIKKASKFCEEVDAPAGFFNVMIEFADIMIDVDAKVSTSENMFYITKTKSFKYNSAVAPNMKAIPDGSRSAVMFWNEKSQSESLVLMKDIDGTNNYHTSISQDPSRMKNNPFRFAKEMVPVVIETTKQQYKDAAKKALENYVNEFVSMVASKKNS